MTEAEYYLSLGTDAGKWAKALILQMNRGNDTDLDSVRSWFAAAIMAGYDSGQQGKQDQLEKLREVYDVQCTCSADSDYGCGLRDGLERALSIFEGRDTIYKET